MVKVVAVVIARNEEKLLPRTLKILNGFKRKGLISEVVVVNDASRDKTALTARASGAIVISNKRIRGKRGSFVAGAEKAKEIGADVMLSLDADIVKFPEETLKRMISKVSGPKGKHLMATAQQWERFRNDFSCTSMIYSNAQRAINMKALEPLFNKKQKWVSALTAGANAKGWRWGLEFALEKLVPKNKKTWLDSSPIYTESAGRQSNLGTAMQEQVASRRAVNTFFAIRKYQAQGIRAERRKKSQRI